VRAIARFFFLSIRFFLKLKNTYVLQQAGKKSGF